MPAVIASQDESPISFEKSSFKIYPNPTTGIFTLECNEKIPEENVQMDVYGICGEKVLTEMLTGGRRHVFSLTDRPVGIYFIRVIAGTTVETIKVVRQ